MKPFLNIVRKLPDGYSKVFFRNNVYGMSVSRFNEGKSIKVYVEELGGADFISMNYLFGSKEAYFNHSKV